MKRAQRVAKRDAHVDTHVSVHAWICGVVNVRAESARVKNHAWLRLRSDC